MAPTSSEFDKAPVIGDVICPRVGTSSARRPVRPWLLAEVLINQRTQQIPIARHARRRSVAQHQLALKFDQPSKLLRAGQKMTREPCERLVGEQLDQFRHEQAGGWP